jgi:LPS O-antigen subunit length determinant protein (WzzB/FepE family)
VIYAAAIHGFLQTLWTVVVCILLVALELLVVALIVAPRWVARKLVSLIRAPARRAQRVLRRSSPRREASRPSREGA